MAIQDFDSQEQLPQQGQQFQQDLQQSDKQQPDLGQFAQEQFSLSQSDKQLLDDMNFQPEETKTDIYFDNEGKAYDDIPEKMIEAYDKTQFQDPPTEEAKQQKKQDIERRKSEELDLMTKNTYEKWSNQENKGRNKIRLDRDIQRQTEEIETRYKNEYDDFIKGVVKEEIKKPAITKTANNVIGATDNAVGKMIDDMNSALYGVAPLLENSYTSAQENVDVSFEEGYKKSIKNGYDTYQKFVTAATSGGLEDGAIYRINIGRQKVYMVANKKQDGTYEILNAGQAVEGPDGQVLGLYTPIKQLSGITVDPELTYITGHKQKIKQIDDDPAIPEDQKRKKKAELTVKHAAAVARNVKAYELYMSDPNVSSETKLALMASLYPAQFKEQYSKYLAETGDDKGALDRVLKAGLGIITSPFAVVGFVSKAAEKGISKIAEEAAATGMDLTDVPMGTLALEIERNPELITYIDKVIKDAGTNAPMYLNSTTGLAQLVVAAKTMMRNKDTYAFLTQYKDVFEKINIAAGGLNIAGNNLKVGVAEYGMGVQDILDKSGYTPILIEFNKAKADLESNPDKNVRDMYRFIKIQNAIYKEDGTVDEEGLASASDEDKFFAAEMTKKIQSGEGKALYNSTFEKVKKMNEIARRGQEAFPKSKIDEYVAMNQPRLQQQMEAYNQARLKFKDSPIFSERYRFLLGGPDQIESASINSDFETFHYTFPSESMESMGTNNALVYTSPIFRFGINFAKNTASVFRNISETTDMITGVGTGRYSPEGQNLSYSLMEFERSLQTELPEANTYAEKVFGWTGGALPMMAAYGASFAAGGPIGATSFLFASMTATQMREGANAGLGIGGRFVYAMLTIGLERFAEGISPEMSLMGGFKGKSSLTKELVDRIMVPKTRTQALKEYARLIWNKAKNTAITGGLEQFEEEVAAKGTAIIQSFFNSATNSAFNPTAGGLNQTVDGLLTMIATTMLFRGGIRVAERTLKPTPPTKAIAKEMMQVSPMLTKDEAMVMASLTNTEGLTTAIGIVNKVMSGEIPTTQVNVDMIERLKNDFIPVAISQQNTFAGMPNLTMQQRAVVLENMVRLNQMKDMVDNGQVFQGGAEAAMQEFQNNAQTALVDPAFAEKQFSMTNDDLSNLVMDFFGVAENIESFRASATANMGQQPTAMTPEEQQRQMAPLDRQAFSREVKRVFMGVEGNKQFEPIADKQIETDLEGFVNAEINQAKNIIELLKSTYAEVSKTSVAPAELEKIDKYTAYIKELEALKTRYVQSYSAEAAQGQVVGQSAQQMQRATQYREQANVAANEVANMTKEAGMESFYVKAMQPGNEMLFMEEAASQVAIDEQAAVKEFGQKAVDRIKQYIKDTNFTTPLPSIMTVEQRAEQEVLNQKRQALSDAVDRINREGTPEQMADVKTLVDRLKKAFPGVKVVMDKKGFKEALKDEAARNMMTKGGVVYGRVMGDTIYLNPDFANFNTPIHEFGHLWINVARESNPELYKRGIDLIRDSEYMDKIKSDPLYQGLTENEMEEEALAMAIGDRGEQIVNEVRRNGFKKWMRRLLRKMSQHVGIFNMSKAQLDTIDLNQYLNMVNASLLSGEPLTFNKLSERNRQFQVIGVKARLAQDVRDNLQVARDMEASGKDAKTVRIATGWERGGDGLWRYEIQDLTLTEKIKAYFDNPLTSIGGVKLSDAISDTELLKLYPEISDINIKLYMKADGVRGMWDKAGNTIRLNLFEGGHSKSVLLHEIQHAIQDIEGFAKGGNIAQMTTPNEVLQKLASSSTLPKLEKDARATAKQKTKEKGLRFSEVFYFDVIKDDPNTIEEAIERLEILNEVSPNDAYVKLIEALDYKLMEMGGEDVALEKYKRLAGEVEARNVEARMGMTPEQRRMTTLQQTEDVSREDQIQFGFEGSDEKTRKTIPTQFMARQSTLTPYINETAKSLVGHYVRNGYSIDEAIVKSTSELTSDLLGRITGRLDTDQLVADIQNAVSVAAEEQRQIKREEERQAKLNKAFAAPETATIVNEANSIADAIVQQNKSATRKKTSKEAYNEVLNGVRDAIDRMYAAGNGPAGVPWISMRELAPAIAFDATAAKFSQIGRTVLNPQQTVTLPVSQVIRGAIAQQIKAIGEVQDRAGAVIEAVNKALNEIAEMYGQSIGLSKSKVAQLLKTVNKAVFSSDVTDIAIQDIADKVMKVVERDLRKNIISDTKSRVAKLEAELKAAAYTAKGIVEGVSRIVKADLDAIANGNTDLFDLSMFNSILSQIIKGDLGAVAAAQSMLNILQRTPPTQTAVTEHESLLNKIKRTVKKVQGIQNLSLSDIEELHEIQQEVRDIEERKNNISLLPANQQAEILQQYSILRLTDASNIDNIVKQKEAEIVSDVMSIISRINSKVKDPLSDIRDNIGNGLLYGQFLKLMKVLDDDYISSLKPLEILDLSKKLQDVERFGNYGHGLYLHTVRAQRMALKGKHHEWGVGIAARRNKIGSPGLVGTIMKGMRDFYRTFTDVEGNTPSAENIANNMDLLKLHAMDAELYSGFDELNMGYLERELFGKLSSVIDAANTKATAQLGDIQRSMVNFSAKEDRAQINIYIGNFWKKYNLGSTFFFRNLLPMLKKGKTNAVYVDLSVRMTTIIAHQIDHISNLNEGDQRIDVVLTRNILGITSQQLQDVKSGKLDPSVLDRTMEEFFGAGGNMATMTHNDMMDAIAYAALTNNGAWTLKDLTVDQLRSLLTGGQRAGLDAWRDHIENNFSLFESAQVVTGKMNAARINYFPRRVYGERGVNSITDTEAFMNSHADAVGFDRTQMSERGADVGKVDLNGTRVLFNNLRSLYLLHEVKPFLDYVKGIGDAISMENSNDNVNHFAVAYMQGVDMALTRRIEENLVDYEGSSKMHTNIIHKAIVKSQSFAAKVWLISGFRQIADFAGNLVKFSGALAFEMKSLNTEVLKAFRIGGGVNKRMVSYTRSGTRVTTAGIRGWNDYMDIVKLTGSPVYRVMSMYADNILEDYSKTPEQLQREQKISSWQDMVFKKLGWMKRFEDSFEKLTGRAFDHESFKDERGVYRAMMMEHVEAASAAADAFIDRQVGLPSIGRQPIAKQPFLPIVARGLRNIFTGKTNRTLSVGRGSNLSLITGFLQGYTTTQYQSFSAYMKLAFSSTNGLSVAKRTEYFTRAMVENVMPTLIYSFFRAFQSTLFMTVVGASYAAAKSGDDPEKRKRMIAEMMKQKFWERQMSKARASFDGMGDETTQKLIGAMQSVIIDPQTSMFIKTAGGFALFLFWKQDAVSQMRGMNKEQRRKTKDVIRGYERFWLSSLGIKPIDIMSTDEYKEVFSLAYGTDKIDDGVETLLGMIGGYSAVSGVLSTASRNLNILLADDKAKVDKDVASAAAVMQAYGLLFTTAITGGKLTPILAMIGGDVNRFAKTMVNDEYSKLQEYKRKTEKNKIMVIQTGGGSKGKRGRGRGRSVGRSIGR